MSTSLDYSKTYWCDFRPCPELYDSTLALLKATGIKVAGDSWSKTAIAWDPSVPRLDLSSAAYREERNHQQLPLPEFITLVLNRPKAPKAIEVVLNGEYTAKVTASFVKVGCQTFSPEAIDKLMAACAEVRKSVDSPNEGTEASSYEFDGVNCHTNLPPNLDGFDQVLDGEIQHGDLLVWYDGTIYAWAKGYVGSPVTNMSLNTYRRRS